MELTVIKQSFPEPTTDTKNLKCRDDILKHLKKESSDCVVILEGTEIAMSQTIDGIKYVVCQG